MISKWKIGLSRTDNGELTLQNKIICNPECVIDHVFSDSPGTFDVSARSVKLRRLLQKLAEAEEDDRVPADFFIGCDQQIRKRRNKVHGVSVIAHQNENLSAMQLNKLWKMDPGSRRVMEKWFRLPEIIKSPTPMFSKCKSYRVDGWYTAEPEQQMLLYKILRDLNHLQELCPGFEQYFIGKNKCDLEKLGEVDLKSMIQKIGDNCTLLRESAVSHQQLVDYVHAQTIHMSSPEYLD